MTMTPLEKLAVQQAGELYVTLCMVVGHGSTRGSDLRELAIHVHAIQNAVLSQSAAREQPDVARLLGA